MIFRVKRFLLKSPHMRRWTPPPYRDESAILSGRYHSLGVDSSADLNRAGLPDALTHPTPYPRCCIRDLSSTVCPSFDH